MHCRIYEHCRTTTCELPRTGYEQTPVTPGGTADIHERLEGAVHEADEEVSAGVPDDITGEESWAAAKQRHHGALQKQPISNAEQTRALNLTPPLLRPGRRGRQTLTRTHPVHCSTVRSADYTTRNTPAYTVEQLKAMLTSDLYRSNIESKPADFMYAHRDVWHKQGHFDVQQLCVLAELMRGLTGLRVGVIICGARDKRSPHHSLYRSDCPLG